MKLTLLEMSLLRYPPVRYRMLSMVSCIPPERNRANAHAKFRVNARYAVG